jgi:hypothetical protein
VPCAGLSAALCGVYQNLHFLDEIEQILDNRTRLHHSQASAILDHSRALPQGDGRAGPPFTRSAVGSECNLIVLDASYVLHDAFAVRGRGIDAEGKMSSQLAHLRPLLPQSSSSSRFTANASGFFILSQSGERPDR